MRYLGYGLRAWGGPVAQIAMLREDLVDREQWIDAAHFKRVLALYQVLPGPEAHELCVYFGMLAGGRRGGLLAGLGFMLPGTVLMLGLASLYAHGRLAAPWIAAIFLGAQPAVLALIVRGGFKLAKGLLSTPMHRLLAVLAAALTLLDVPFWVTLGGIGLCGSLIARRGSWRLFGWTLLASGVLLALGLQWPPSALSTVVTVTAPAVPSRWELLASGLQVGLLTFGGAYTAIPLMRDQATSAGWVSDSQFLDGLALSGLLPAPLIIFSTFVGTLAAGIGGGLIVTSGAFLPSFAMTLLAHRWLERLAAHPLLHAFLDSIAAGLVGLVAVAAWTLAPTALRTVPSWGIAIVSLLLLTFWHHPLAVPLAVLGGGLLGLLLH